VLARVGRILMYALSPRSRSALISETWLEIAP